MSHLPILAIIVPLIGGILIALTGLIRPAVRAIVAVGVAGLHGVLLLLLVVRVFTDGPLEYFPGGWLPPVGIHLTVDAFSAFFLLLLAVGHPAAVLFRLATDGRSGWEDKSATLGAWYFAALAGITVTADLFNLFVFVELATVTTLGLIARKGRENSTVAGFVYLVLASLSGVLLLVSILLIYLTTGTVTSVLVAQRVATVPPHIHAIITGCMLISFGIKFGMVPLHLWQPRAYLGAGSTVSAIFSAFGMKIYLYALIRLLWLPLHAPELLPRVFDLLLVAGMVNILVGHLAALSERNLIRMLAFSSVAHVGYILLGVAAGGRAGTLGTAALVATLFHIAMHSLAKATLLWSGRLFIAV
ncbi:MAG: proton-conducting transporter membrane subunit, partial [Alkalispirochaeta sp.]